MMCSPRLLVMYLLILSRSPDLSSTCPTTPHPLHKEMYFTTPPKRMSFETRLGLPSLGVLTDPPLYGPYP